MTIIYDISAFRSQGASIPALQQVVGVNDSGALVTGISNLVQRFVCRLFTIKGSLPYDATKGCNFLLMLQANGMLSEIDILSAFQAALLDLRKCLKAEDKPTDPQDEQYASAQLLGITITDTGLLLNIQVNSVAGGSVNETVPLAFKLN